MVGRKRWREGKEVERKGWKERGGEEERKRWKERGGEEDYSMIAMGLQELDDVATQVKRKYATVSGPLQFDRAVH